MLRFPRKLLLSLMPAGIRQRLFLLIALVLLPLVLLLGWIYYQRYESRRHQEFQTQFEIAEVIASNFQTYVKSIHNQSFVTGKAIVNLDIYTEQKAEYLLETAAGRYQGIRNMSWVAVDGTVLASSVPGFAGRSLGHRPYFQEAVKNKHWAIGDITERGTITPAPTVAIASAIHDDTGFLRGVVVAGIEPNQLGESVSIKTRPGGGSYTIFDSQGVLVFRCPEIPLTWERRTGWIRSDPLLRATLKTRQPHIGFTELAVLGKQRRLSARVPVPEIGWVVGTGRPAEVTFQAIWVGLIWDSAIAVTVCAGAFLLAYLFSRTISIPILHLQTDAQRMGHGEITKKREPYAPYEVQSLREQIEELASTLITRAGQLAEATNDLKAKNAELESIISITSHDLKSPVVNIMGFSGELARSLGTLKERLLEHGNDFGISDIMTVLDSEIPEEMNFIRKNTRSIDQMLESLAKVVHIVLAEIRPTRVNVNELLTSMMPQFHERIQKEKVDFTIERLPDCHADPALLKEILFNLIENAITYLVAGRKGKISIGGSIQGAYAVYSVKDNGRGIAPSHQENIFKLFHKLDVSEEGEGIGLTVSKRLVERQSGSLWVESQPDGGSTFFLSLPKA